jgi:hypothetical protein
MCLRSGQRARSGDEDDRKSKCNFGEHGVFLLVGLTTLTERFSQYALPRQNSMTEPFGHGDVMEYRY